MSTTPGNPTPQEPTPQEPTPDAPRAEGTAANFAAEVGDAFDSIRRQGETVLKTRLERSRTSRWLGGVCGGIAESYGWDANLIRLLTVALTPVAFPLVPALYALAWVIIPQKEI